MFVDFPFNVILMMAAAFLIGWILSSIKSAFSSKRRAKARDPRDDRIRSLEAEHRIAQADLAKTTKKFEALEKELEDARDSIEKRDSAISQQQLRLDGMKKDLTDSVKKTRELRAELSDRATENVKSEVKLREVETELSVAHASTDMIATGVLDYSLAPDGEEIELAKTADKTK
ncbi:MAG: hypothetical protein IIA10_10170 [Proteobacteria bacterium]|nr:hypothetical protein [Pseudomonadota bacterium]